MLPSRADTKVPRSAAAASISHGANAQQLYATSHSDFGRRTPRATKSQLAAVGEALTAGAMTVRLTVVNTRQHNGIGYYAVCRGNRLRSAAAKG